MSKSSGRRRSRKAAAAPEAAPAPTADPLEGLRALLSHPRAAWAGPLLAALAALLVGVWTFDPKLSMSGDNTEFVTLARSLAAGDGLSYINRPVPEPSVKFPFGLPLLLAPVAAWFGGWDGSGMPDWVAMKWVVVMTFAGAMGFFYLLARDRVGPISAVAATALALSNREVVSYGHQVMSEVPYLLPSLAALWLLERGIEREGWRDNGWLWAGLAAAVVAYYVRTVAVVLLGATIAVLLLRRDVRRALLVAAVAVLAAVPWTLRNQALGGGGEYLRQLVMVNPYRPELGDLDLEGIFDRVAYHIDFYLRGDLTQALWPSFEGADQMLSPISVAMLAILVGNVVLCIRRQQHLLLLTYSVFYTGTIILWPWSGARFFVPLLPILVLQATHTVAAALAWLRQHAGSQLTPWVGGALLALALWTNAMALTRLAADSRADYVSYFRNYYDAGLWLRANTPADAVVSCRKPFWMYVVSGRRTAIYEFAPPPELLAGLERDGVDYVVIEQLGFPQTGEFLVPAMMTAQDRFELEWEVDDPESYIFRFE